MCKSGLVLEGGGIRTLYTSGVLDAFIENNIEFDYVIGVSAGTCNGVSFLGKNLHRMRDLTIEYSCDERYKSVKSMIKNGEYLNSKWIFGELTYELYPLDYDTYEKSNAKFCAVVTNVDTGKSEYLYPEGAFRNDCEELRASCALPIATKPVVINGKRYSDGGVSDSIPLERAFDDGCERCVTILTQHRDYVKQPVSPAPAVKLLLHKYPELLKAVLNRHNMYNEQKKFVFEKEKTGETFVICPEQPLNASTLNVTTEQQRQLYKTGYEQGIKLIDDVKKYLNK